MSTWLERLENFRFVETDFDGTRALKTLFDRGTWSGASEKDWKMIVKDCSEFLTDKAAVEFLRERERLI